MKNIITVFFYRFTTITFHSIMFNIFKKNNRITVYNNLNQTHLIYYLIKSWNKLSELYKILNLFLITKKMHNYYTYTPLNNQKTRSRKPIYYKPLMKYKFYTLLLKLLNMIRLKLNRNYVLFEYINRLWWKQWKKEWFLIRLKRIKMKKIAFKGRVSINFSLLKFKHVIRNLKVMDRKKQKFLDQFNLGFFLFEYISLKSKFNKKILRKNYNKYFIFKSSKKKIV